MAYNVPVAETRDRHAFDGPKLCQCFEQSFGSASGQVALRRVARHHHAGIFAETGVPPGNAPNPSVRGSGVSTGEDATARAGAVGSRERTKTQGGPDAVKS